MTKRAVCCLSGGLDSATALAIADNQGYECYALSFDYKQSNVSEVNAAKKVAAHFNVKNHKILSLPFDELKGSALTDPDIPIPDYQGDKRIPITYVPARNTIFLSFALSWAEVVDADSIFTGFCAVDYSGYPDCRPEYLDAYQRMANLSNKRGVEGNPVAIHAPLVNLSKVEIIEIGHRLGVPYHDTISCYRADEAGQACGRCDSCHYRKQGFQGAKLPDPTPYQ